MLIFGLLMCIYTASAVLRRSLLGSLWMIVVLSSSCCLVMVKPWWMVIWHRIASSSRWAVILSERVVAVKPSRGEATAITNVARVLIH